MKQIIKMIGLVTLICFSFFYTEKVIDVASVQDEIMIKINQVKDNYKIDVIDATISDDTIIPGINGKEVDVEKSYNEMKQVGIFKEMLLSYKQIEVKDSLKNNLDKYVIKANGTKKSVSLVFYVNNQQVLENIIKKENVILNLFIDYKLLSTNLNKLDKNDLFIYTYADNGVYSNDILIYSNNLINRNFNNKSLYCITDSKNEKVLTICKNNNMITIIPNILDNNYVYNNIKTNLVNGSIIKLDTTNKTLNEFDTIVDFIKSKGYKIVSLEELLSENRN